VAGAPHLGSRPISAPGGNSARPYPARAAAALRRQLPYDTYPEQLLRSRRRHRLTDCTRMINLDRDDIIETPLASSPEV
jgi:hypothetical protein